MNNSATEQARKILAQRPVYLDTETTGLGNRDEIVSIGIVDHDGMVLLDTLVQPTIPIPFRAYQIHGISDDDVAHAPSFVEIWNSLVRVLSTRHVVIYNSKYDTRMLEQSATAHWGYQGGLIIDDNNATYRKIPAHAHVIKTANISCAMKLYALFYSQSGSGRSSKWQKLGHAAKQCNLVIPPDLHMP